METLSINLPAARVWTLNPDAARFGILNPCGIKKKKSKVQFELLQAITQTVLFLCIIKRIERAIKKSEN